MPFSLISVMVHFWWWLYPWNGSLFISWEESISWLKAVRTSSGDSQKFKEAWSSWRLKTGISRKSEKLLKNSQTYNKFSKVSALIMTFYIFGACLSMCDPWSSGINLISLSSIGYWIYFPFTNYGYKSEKIYICELKIIFFLKASFSAKV